MSPVADAFLDTNVLLYLLSGDLEKANRAEALVAAGGVVSVQILDEFVSVATRKLGLAISESREILATVRAVCTVKPVDLETHELALDLAEQYRFSIYAALIVAGAVGAGCAVLYTEGLRHGRRIGRLAIRNPL